MTDLKEMGPPGVSPAATPKSAAPALHVVDGVLQGRTFDIVTKRDDGSIEAYVACDVPKEYAHLIAAAPGLLEALKGSIGALQFSQDFHRDLGNEDQAFAADKLDAALKAIAKATDQGEVS